MAAPIDGVAAPDAAEVNPTTNDGVGLDPRRRQSPGGQMQSDLDSTCTADAGQSRGKPWATLRAELALHGIALIDNPRTGGFTAARWALSVDLADLDAVEAFARRVGAVR